MKTDKQREINEIEEQLKARVTFTNIVFNLNKDNFNQAKEMIPQFPTKWVQQLIIFVGNNNKTNIKILADLFQLTGKSTLDHRYCSYFEIYLYIRKIITDDNFGKSITDYLHRQANKTAEEYENPIKPGSIEETIRNDDIARFEQFFIRRKQINPEKTPSDIYGGFSNLIDLTCFFGSFNILKYFVTNDYKLSYNAFCYIIDTRSEKCINYLFAKRKFNNSYLSQFVGAHMNSYAKSFIASHPEVLCGLNEMVPIQKYFRLPNCVYYMNMDMLLYLLNEKKWDINAHIRGRSTCLHLAVQNDDLILVKYLLLKGIDRTLIDRRDNKAEDYAKSEEMKDIFKTY